MVLAEKQQKRWQKEVRGGDLSVEKGAEAPVYLAISDQIKAESGSYFINKKKKKPAAAAFNQELQDELWNKSIEMINHQDILNKIPDWLLNS